MPIASSIENVKNLGFCKPFHSRLKSLFRGNPGEGRGRPEIQPRSEPHSKNSGFRLSPEWRSKRFQQEPLFNSLKKRVSYRAPTEAITPFFSKLQLAPKRRYSNSQNRVEWRCLIIAKIFVLESRKRESGIRGSFFAGVISDPIPPFGR